MRSLRAAPAKMSRLGLAGSGDTGFGQYLKKVVVAKVISIAATNGSQPNQIRSDEPIAASSEGMCLLHLDLCSAWCFHPPTNGMVGLANIYSRSYPH